MTGMHRLEAIGTVHRVQDASPAPHGRPRTAFATRRGRILHPNVVKPDQPFPEGTRFVLDSEHAAAPYVTAMLNWLHPNGIAAQGSIHTRWTVRELGRLAIPLASQAGQERAVALRKHATAAAAKASKRSEALECLWVGMSERWFSRATTVTAPLTPSAEDTVSVVRGVPDRRLGDGHHAVRRIRGRDVTTPTLQHIERLQYDLSDTPVMDAHRLRPGDVVLPIMPSPTRGLRPMVVEYIPDEDVLPDPSTVVIRMSGSVDDAWYLWAYLRSPAGQHALQSRCVRGTTVAHLRTQALRSLPVPVAGTDLAAAIVRQARAFAALERGHLDMTELAPRVFDALLAHLHESDTLSAFHDP